MGKGDIKSKKGKISNGSYGVTRKKKKAKPTIKAATPKVEKVEKPKAEKAPVKKVPVKKEAK